MIVLLICGAVAALTAAVYLFFTKNKNYWKKRGVVEPEPAFFYGNIKDMVLRQKTSNFQFYEFYRQFPNEKYVGLYRFQNPIILVKDLDLIKRIMIKDFDNFVDRGLEFSEKGLGMNVFHTSSDSWKALRSKFSPTFTSGKLKGMFHLMNSSGDNFAKYVQETQTRQQEVEIYPLLQKYTKIVICSCAFGLDIDLDNDDMFEKLRKIDNAVLTITYMNELDWMFPGILKKLSLDLFPSEVFRFFYNLVTDIFKQRNGVPSNRKDFMDLILEIKKAGSIQGFVRGEGETGRVIQIDDALIAANAFVFYVAGFETSAGTMSFMLHELAYHPEIQERLVAEINEVLERHGGQLVYEALAEMTYLTQVFDETLRKYSLAVDPLFRVASEDYKVPDSDLVIEKGVRVAVSARGIHYDEKYYPDPYKFVPERFSPENTKTRHPAAYLPFGIGPRNCIGMRFAQVASRVCIVKLLPKVRVEPGPSSIYDLNYDPYALVLRTLNGIPLKLVARN